MSRREEILRRTREVERMPAAVGEAMSLLADPEPDMARLARALEHDPSITATLLKLANSSYFGSVRTVTSVREAVVRMGLTKVSQLVVAAGVAPRAKPGIDGYGLAPCKLLENAIAVAVAAEDVGRAAGAAVPEHTFTAGLLSPIGKTVLGTFLEVDAGPILELAEAEGLTFADAECEVLGVDHAEVGAVLLEHWGLPGEIVLVVRHHLRPDDAPGPDTALDLVHMGDALTKMSGIGLGVDGTNYRPSMAVAERLGLDADMADAVQANLLESVDELWEIFVDCDS